MLAQDGKFPETWAATIGVTMSTLYNWANKYPEFDEAMHIAWHLVHHYWTEEAAKAAKGGSGINSPTVLLEILRKRLPTVYGSVPQGTYDHFQRRNDVEPVIENENGQGVIAKDISQMTSDELDAEIQRYEQNLRDRG